MRFWDSTALVPLLASLPATAAAVQVLAMDPDIITGAGSETECAAAVARLERDGALRDGAARAAFGRLDALAAAWNEIQPTRIVRSTALRLLRTHPLGPDDALQLAGAIVAAEGEPASLTFVTLDERLATAAEREGFVVLGRSRR